MVAVLRHHLAHILNGPALPRRVADVLPVQNLVENMIWTLVRDTKNRRRIMQNTMALLFLELLNCTDRLAASEDEGEHSTLVMTALREIEENYRTASLKELAEKCGVCVLTSPLEMYDACGILHQHGVTGAK